MSQRGFVTERIGANSTRPAGRTASIALRLLVRYATDSPAAVLSNEINGLRHVILGRFGEANAHAGGGVVASDVDVRYRRRLGSDHIPLLAQLVVRVYVPGGRVLLRVTEQRRQTRGIGVVEVVV